MTSAGESRFHIFPWREEEAVLGRGRALRPTLDVKLSLGNLSTTTKALVDTGAPKTVFPRGVGDALDISFPAFPSDAEESVILMGHRWPAINQSVDLELPPFADLGWHAPVLFVLDEGLPFALLGLEGFLDRWAVSFNGAMSYFVVEPAEAFDNRIPPEPFEELQRRFPDEYEP